MNDSRSGAILVGIVKQFSQKQFPLMCAKSFISAPGIPSSSWSLGNQIVMRMSGTADARGYNQWRKVYRNVKKGAKAMHILVPARRKIIDHNDDDREKHIISGFITSPVFRYEDTEGAPLPEYKPAVLPPLLKLAEHEGIDVKWVNSKFGEYGSIDTKGKIMTLSTDSVDTFLHELVHWYDRKNVKVWKNGQDPEQETVAQLGACVLSEMYGYNVKEFTWNYIASYARSDSPEKVGKMCLKVLGRVQKAINNMLEDAKVEQQPHKDTTHVVSPSDVSITSKPAGTKNIATQDKITEEV